MIVGFNHGLWASKLPSLNLPSNFTSVSCYNLHWKCTLFGQNGSPHWPFYFSGSNMVYGLGNSQHWIRHQIVPKKVGITYILTQNWKCPLFGQNGSPLGPLEGSNILYWLRNCHHWICHQILPHNIWYNLHSNSKSKMFTFWAIIGVHMDHYIALWGSNMVFGLA
jgi:hypothetical protein